MAIEQKTAESGRTAIKFVDAGYFLFIAAWVAWRVPVGPRYVVGLCIAAIGFVLWMVARQQLGKSFTVSAQAKSACDDRLIFQNSQSHLFLRWSCVFRRFSRVGEPLCAVRSHRSLFRNAVGARAERISGVGAGVRG